MSPNTHQIHLDISSLTIDLCLNVSQFNLNIAASAQLELLGCRCTSAQMSLRFCPDTLDWDTDGYIRNKNNKVSQRFVRTRFDWALPRGGRSRWWSKFLRFSNSSIAEACCQWLPEWESRSRWVGWGSALCLAYSWPGLASQKWRACCNIWWNTRWCCFHVSPLDSPSCSQTFSFFYLWRNRSSTLLLGRGLPIKRFRPIAEPDLSSQCLLPHFRAGSRSTLEGGFSGLWRCLPLSRRNTFRHTTIHQECSWGVRGSSGSRSTPSFNNKANFNANHLMTFANHFKSNQIAKF